MPAELAAWETTNLVTVAAALTAAGFAKGDRLALLFDDVTARKRAEAAFERAFEAHPWLAP